MKKSKVIDLTQLEPNTNLVVETELCIYDIVVLDPETAEISIAGGSTFTDVCTGFLESSCGKSGAVKMSIAKDMVMIIRYKRSADKRYRTLETDQVKSVTMVNPSKKWSLNVWEDIS